MVDPRDFDDHARCDYQFGVGDLRLTSEDRMFDQLHARLQQPTLGVRRIHPLRVLRGCLEEKVPSACPDQGAAPCSSSVSVRMRPTLPGRPGEPDVMVPLTPRWR